MNLALIIMVLLYALFAGLHTVFDLDMGWHLATGRYVVQHHVIPSTDVLSYTSAGTEWIYPPFAGVLLYGIFRAWGYAGLSWFCSLALAAMAACLLRSPSRKDSGVAAALAILAVPSLAQRATPRADLFTTLFFAIFLAQLWSFHRSSPVVGSNPAELRQRSARLWVLPLLMLFWVNLHPGFIAGLGMLFAYLLIEGLELLFPGRRSAVLERLKQACPPLAATVVATLFNPYGLRIFKVALHLAGFGQSSQLSAGPLVVELTARRLSLASLIEAVDWRNPFSSYWWLVLMAVLVITVALWRRQFGAALLMAAALYVSIQHLRYQALFACVVVVVGSTTLTEALQDRKLENAKFAARFGGLRFLPVFAASVLGLLTCVRIVDLVSDRSYHLYNFECLFGPGESWWFPERAAAFILREHLPGNIFQPYNLGGFTAWRLGPAYGDFIDGRNISVAVWAEEEELLSSPLDSPVWETASDRTNINVLFFSLARSYGLGGRNVLSLCQSRNWRPVYMDEVSIVLLHNRPENRPWIDKYEVNCQTHNFAPPPRASRGELFDFYANAGTVLLGLGRLNEAQEVLNRGVAIFPEDPSIHMQLAMLYDAQQNFDDAEREWQLALSLRRDDALYWYNAGQFYFMHGRYADARSDIDRARRLSSIPIDAYIALGWIDLKLRQPQQALTDFDQAEGASQGRQTLNPAVHAEIAEGRSMAYFALNDEQRALEVLQEAIGRTPNVASLWQALGGLYDALGQSQLAEQAHQKARALSN